MKELFLILFFGKVMLLTPDPIGIKGPVELMIDKPLTAITSGASILIDVSSMVSMEDREAVLQSSDRLYELFPRRSIVAKLSGRGVDDVVLEFNGGYLIGKDSIELTVDTEDGVPTGVEFGKVMIESSIELDRVRVFWKNYKH